MIELPANIRYSAVLTSDEKLALAEVDQFPAINPSFDDSRLKEIIQYYSISTDEMDMELYKYASILLSQGKVNEAWQVLLTTA